jgi:hypothetical protein
MHVENRLPAVALAVGHDSVARLIEAVPASQGSCENVGRTDELAVLCPQVEDGLDVPAWEDEQVDGRGGVDVLDHDERFVLVDFLGRNLALDDPAE